MLQKLVVVVNIER